MAELTAKHNESIRVYLLASKDSVVNVVANSPGIVIIVIVIINIIHPHQHGCHPHSVIHADCFPALQVTMTVLESQ